MSLQYNVEKETPYQRQPFSRVASSRGNQNPYSDPAVLYRKVAS
jgi:hypothetical protein